MAAIIISVFISLYFLFKYAHKQFKHRNCIKRKKKEEFKGSINYLHQDTSNAEKNNKILKHSYSNLLITH